MIHRCERLDLPDRETRLAEIQRIERDCIAIARRADRKRVKLPSLLRRR